MRFVAKGLCCALIASALPCRAAEVSRGHELFVRKWVGDDPLCPQGDGLGPMHNATSCVACHDQGGVGGGGPRGANVDLLTFMQGDNEGRNSEAMREKLTAIHPAFAAGSKGVKSTIVLHNFGLDRDYGPFRSKFGRDPGSISRGWGGHSSSSQPPVLQVRVVNGLRFQRSQRNTPALWGAGLIDEITSEDLESLAARQQNKKTGVTGRVPRADDGGVGRFGWRGQTSTLRQFVLGACANELGLQTEGQLQAMNPLEPEYALMGIDLSGEQCQALVTFVAELPRPIEVHPGSVVELARVDRGERLFDNIGCAVCHPRQLGRIDGLFSDLLLHDMGEGLADAAEPNPPLVREIRRQSLPSGQGSIYVDIERRTKEMPAEWRTPPLWGVRDSAPYLHDGRAASLHEAIQLHGGEALRAAKQYGHLSEKQRGDLVAFLQTFVAPPDAPRMPGKK